MKNLLIFTGELTQPLNSQEQQDNEASNFYRYLPHERKDSLSHSNHLSTVESISSISADFSTKSSPAKRNI